MCCWCGLLSDCRMEKKHRGKFDRCAAAIFSLLSPRFQYPTRPFFYTFLRQYNSSGSSSTVQSLLRCILFLATSWHDCIAQGTTLNSMDFADLSKYDDLCSDIFLDDLFLWFKTTKMNTTHRKPRIHAKQILDIIQRKVVEERKPNEAVKEVLE